MVSEDDLVRAVGEAWQDVRLAFEEDRFRGSGSSEAEIVGLIDHDLRTTFAAQLDLRFVPQYAIHRRDMGGPNGHIWRRVDLAIERRESGGWRPWAALESKTYVGNDFEHKRNPTKKDRETLAAFQGFARQEGEPAVLFFCYTIRQGALSEFHREVVSLMAGTLKNLWIARGKLSIPPTELVPPTDWVMERL